jgi:hypothetical protein
LTLPIGWQGKSEFSVPVPPRFAVAPEMSVADALKSGPKLFRELMEATGSRDGRDTAVAIDEIRKAGRLARTPEGRYAIKND